MINNSIIKDYAEDYILNSGQDLNDFNIDVIVENLHHVAVVNNMTIEGYQDCDSFPSDDFVGAFEEV
jgi:hypothetical protein